MPDKRDLEPLLNVEQNQLNLVMSDSDGINTTSLAILGANVAILIFIDQASLHLVVWQFILLYAPFVLSLVLDIFSIWPREYLGTVLEPKASTRYLTMGREKLILQLLANTEAAISHNQKFNRQRMRASLASIILTSLGFLALLVIL